jgi:hypothetical protein
MADDATAELAGFLKPLLPAKWEWILDERKVTKPDVVTCVLTPNTIEPAGFLGGKTSTPQYQLTYQLSIIQPGSTADTVEADLFNNVLKLLIGIQRIDRIANPTARGLAWQEAHKALWDNFNLCWQITVLTIVAPLPN